MYTSKLVPLLYLEVKSSVQLRSLFSSTTRLYRYVCVGPESLLYQFVYLQIQNSWSEEVCGDPEAEKSFIKNYCPQQPVPGIFSRITHYLFTKSEH